MFRFVKQIFVSTMMFFSCNLSKVNPLTCVSMSNQECKVRPENINVNSNEPSFYPYSIKINAVVLVAILMVYMQSCVFLMLLKIWILKYST